MYKGLHENMLTRNKKSPKIQNKMVREIGI